MTRPFRFATQGGPFDDPIGLAEHARRVEAMGYDGLFSYDHVGGDPARTDSRVGPGAIDPFAPLVAAALATERLRIGPLVLNNEFHHPVMLARTAATVDRLTGGRLVLGLGTGYDESEHDAIGSPIRPPGPRVTRFGESLTVLRSLLAGEPTAFDGEHLSVHLAHLGVSPLQERVPFLIGGHGRRVVRLAARHADIFQFTGLVHADRGKPTAAGFPVGDVRERARWLADAAGDRDRAIERSVLVQVASIDGEGPTVDEVAQRVALDAEVVAASPFVLIGSVEQVVDELERLRAELGISHVVVREPERFAPVVAALSGR